MDKRQNNGISKQGKDRGTQVYMSPANRKTVLESRAHSASRQGRSNGRKGLTNSFDSQRHPEASLCSPQNQWPFLRMKEFSPTKRSSRSVPVVTPASRAKRKRLHHASGPTGNVTTWPSSQQQPSTHQGGGPTLENDATGTCDGIGGASAGVAPPLHQGYYAFAPPPTYTANHDAPPPDAIGSFEGYPPPQQPHTQHYNSDPIYYRYYPFGPPMDSHDGILTYPPYVHSPLGPPMNYHQSYPPLQPYMHGQHQSAGNFTGSEMKETGSKRPPSDLEQNGKKKERTLEETRTVHRKKQKFRPDLQPREGLGPTKSGKWEATFQYHSKRRVIGTFETEAMAAEAYKIVRDKLLKDQAVSCPVDERDVAKRYNEARREAFEGVYKTAEMAATITDSSDNTIKKADSETLVLQGIFMRPSGKWQAQMYFCGQYRYIGVFTTQEKAARAFAFARNELKSDCLQKAGPPFDEDAAAKRFFDVREASIEHVNEAASSNRSPNTSREKMINWSPIVTGLKNTEDDEAFNLFELDTAKESR